MSTGAKREGVFRENESKTEGKIASGTACRTTFGTEIPQPLPTILLQGLEVGGRSCYSGDGRGLQSLPPKFVVRGL